MSRPNPSAYRPPVPSSSSSAGPMTAGAGRGPPSSSAASSIAGGNLSRQGSQDSQSGLLAGGAGGGAYGGTPTGSPAGMRPRYGPSASSPHSPLPSYASPMAPSGRSSPSPSLNDPFRPASPAYLGAGAGARSRNVSGASMASSSSPGGNGAGSLAPSMNDKFSLSPNPALWGADVSPAHAEPDDYLHNPDPKRDRRSDRGGSIFTVRGLFNLGCIALLVAALLTLFAGYPIITAVLNRQASTLGAFNLGGINATGQVGMTIGNFGLIDADTPESAYYHTSLETGEKWELVFSDEFNTPGRTFWPGDDPYWEAEDYHYWVTNNLEWYNPVNLVTENGYLKITLDKRPDHNLNYSGGLMTTWNKFCFRGGYIETSIMLPGSSSVTGLWPALWTMGNLGRASYGSTTDGMWPYTYNSCDVGTLPNQTLNGLPEVALTSGNDWAPANGTLSYLLGQRLSRCTCANDPTHPGPKNADGTWMGRSAPEIDVIEAQVDTSVSMGQVSQSAQWAPFNPHYTWINDSSTYKIFDTDITHFNSYSGGQYQQATSGLTYTNQDCYEAQTGCFSTYGFEYAPGDDGYISWVSDAKQSWTVRAGSMAANAEAEISARPVPYEPMYIITNLGISENFAVIDQADLDKLWPVHMKIDYVRVYQDPNAKMIGCDPDDMPTAAYIERYKEGYTNPNITTFKELYDDWPVNNLTGKC